MQTRSLLGAIFLSLPLLTACGGGGGSTATPQPTPTINTSPTIAGAPDQTILSGAIYSFSPTAADADNDTLTFSAENLPTWLQLDTSTGELSGTAQESDDITYENIVISVSDGHSSASLPAFQLAVTATTPVSLSGIATDNPLANARITVQLGEHVFEADTDAQGAYTLELLIPKNITDLESPIELHAFGSGAQANAHLVALLPGISELRQLAQTHSPISTSNLNELRITHVSTARYLLVKAMYEGALPETFEQLTAAYGMIDAEQQETVQAAIKLLVDNANYPLDDQDLLALLGSGEEAPETAFKRWLNSRGLLDNGGEYTSQVLQDLAQAQAETQADAAQNLALTESEVVGDLWLHAQPHPRVPADDGRFIRTLAGGQAYVAFHAGGATQSANAMTPASWTLTDGILTIIGNSETATRFHVIYKNQSDAEGLASSFNIHQDFAQHLIDNQWNLHDDFPINKRLVNSTIEVKARDRFGIWVKQESVYEYFLNAEQSAAYNWPSSSVSDQFTEQKMLRLRNTSNESGVSWSTWIQGGESWVLPFEGTIYSDGNGETQRVTYAEHLTFYNDGTVQARLENTLLNWEIDGSLLTISGAGTTFEYRILDQKGILLGTKLSATRADNSSFVVSGLATQDLNQDADFQAVALGEQPEYWQTGLTQFNVANLNGDLTPNQDAFYGWTFLANGDVKMGYPAFDNNGCIDVSKPCVNTYSNRTWALENGIHTITYNYTEAYLKRPWEVMSHSNQQTVVYEHFLFHDDYANNDYYWLGPRLNPVFKHEYIPELWENTPQ